MSHFEGLKKLEELFIQHGFAKVASDIIKDSVCDKGLKPETKDYDIAFLYWTMVKEEASSFLDQRQILKISFLSNKDLSDAVISVLKSEKCSYVGKCAEFGEFSKEVLFDWCLEVQQRVKDIIVSSEEELDPRIKTIGRLDYEYMLFAEIIAFIVNARFYKLRFNHEYSVQDRIKLQNNIIGVIEGDGDAIGKTAAYNTALQFPFLIDPDVMTRIREEIESKYLADARIYNEET